ncbi:MAG: primary-amine oxidase [Planctomycetaceae bacterium]
MRSPVLTDRAPDPKFLPSWVIAAAVAACWVTSGRVTAAEGPVSPHPLDPLSKDEIATAVRVLKSRGEVGPGDRFPMIVLDEPPKDAVWGFKPGDPVRRRAFAVVYDREAPRLCEAVVDLGDRRLASWREVPGAQPGFHGEDYRIVAEIVRADPRWKEAIKRRGIEDPDEILLETWGPGSDLRPDERGGRAARVICYDRGRSRNPYARPIEGLVVSVDLRAKRVLRVQDTGGPIAKADTDFASKSIGPTRTAPKPLRIAQPEGASFEVRGREVRWQNWRFRFALHPREGLVLYTVGYEDRGRFRPILYRAALSEMVVPYGDPGPGWSFRNAFDEGEYGFGSLADSLEPGTDCPANATFFDEAFPNDDGVTFREIPRAVALFERDGGVLWRHASHDTAGTESRRARQLVLTSFTTLGNYTYGFEWIFHQDGALELEVVHTGIMLVKAAETAMAPPHGGDATPFGYEVDAGLVAIHHQHFFNVRLDLDVDGVANSVMELATEAVPEGPKNPHGNAFIMRETLLRSERAGRRQLDLASGRKWKVVNRSVPDATGHPSGYLLVPGENTVPYASANSSARGRAGFLDAHVWITRHDPAQMHAAGEYPTLSPGGDGLPRWVAADRPLEDQDVVVWYTMGVTHTPRPEEWPVMPSRRVGFVLLP